MRKTLIILVTALSLLGAVIGQCNVKSYNTKLVPACTGRDFVMKWPNYEDQRTFHQCFTDGTSQLISCPAGQVFTYVLQMCTTCDSYIPAVECELLRTDQPPKCVPFTNSGPPSSPVPEPTEEPEDPEVPETTESPQDPEVPETTVEPEDPEVPETTETPETGEPSYPPTLIPPPPSPKPEDPNVVPTPPTVNPTPPLLGLIA